MKTYSIRVPDDATAGIASGQMQACLRRFFLTGDVSQIAPDPGAGDVVIRRSLDERLVGKFSAALGASPGVALRRLAATCVLALPAGSPPARALPSLPASKAPNASHPGDSLPLWAVPWLVGGLYGPVPESPTAADPPASQMAAISPWRAFWGKAWPELLVFVVLLVIGWYTGGLDVVPSAADAQPYPFWRPE